MNIVDYLSEIKILQIGCGGTGSWVVPLVSKLINNIRLRLPDTVQISYKLIDDDAVEERNILRQNFNEWDIGKGKAQSLVNKFIYNFKDLQSTSYRIKTRKDIFGFCFSPFREELENLNSLTIIIGCVDNNKSRHLIYKSLKYFLKNYDDKKKHIYIDSGNLLYNGQVVTLSFGFEEFLIKKLEEYEPDKAIELKKQIKKRKKLNFTKMFPLENPIEVQQNCAFFGDQSQAINSLSANIIFCNLQKILVASEMPPQMITYNSSGYSTFEI